MLATLHHRFVREHVGSSYGVVVLSRQLLFCPALVCRFQSVTTGSPDIALKHALRLDLPLVN